MKPRANTATHPQRQLLPCGGVTRSTVVLSGVSRLMEAPGMDRHTDSRSAVENVCTRTYDSEWFNTIHPIALV